MKKRERPVIKAPEEKARSSGAALSNYLLGKTVKLKARAALKLALPVQLRLTTMRLATTSHIKSKSTGWKLCFHHEEMKRTKSGVYQTQLRVLRYFVVTNCTTVCVSIE
jgi:hypothetical protein